ncbi:superoxide dismutase, partial [Geopyxis carbonaria]
TLFAVPLKCEACVKSVSESIGEIPGIVGVDADLKEQLVAVEGTAAPSTIVAAIQATGRDAILRGSGKSNSAAVSILETHVGGIAESPVRGLARMVQVSPKLTIIDVTLKGLSPGTYFASVRVNGDISEGAVSTGAVWNDSEPNEGPKGNMGQINVGNNGIGNVLLDKPIEIWELIGRSFVISKQNSDSLTNDKDTLVGVIARSAGVWENTKTVCSCSGKGVWDERTEQIGRGML